MADIAASDVTYTGPGYYEQQDSDGQREGIFGVSFGDGALTYPTGGVPLDKAKLGCPNSVTELSIIDPANANGFVYKTDLANLKLRIYQGDNDAVADGPLVELVGGAATPAVAALKIKAMGW